MTKILRKLSAKTVNASEIGEGFSVYGMASTAKLVKTNYGESFQFGGIFRIVTDSGERYEGMSLYLSGGYDRYFAAALQTAQDEDKNATLKIQHHFKKVEAKNPMGSEWVMTELSENRYGNSALDALESTAKPLAITDSSAKPKAKAKKKAA